MVVVFTTHMIMTTMAPCLGTDYIDSCKYNYHMIMATMAPCLGTDYIDSCKGAIVAMIIW
jgi:hypothetical protein